MNHKLKFRLINHLLFLLMGTTILLQSEVQRTPLLDDDEIGQITGSASWNGNLFGSIKGATSGNAIEFTISYPGNVTGLYKGTLSNNGTVNK